VHATISTPSSSLVPSTARVTWYGPWLQPRSGTNTCVRRAKSFPPHAAWASTSTTPAHAHRMPPCDRGRAAFQRDGRYGSEAMVTR
jgi:hypothetical protein